MPNINDLGLNDKRRGMKMDTVPVGMGSRPTTPQPGIYKFRLPSGEAIMSCFDTQDTGDDKILVAKFSNEAMLYNLSTRTWYSTMINNRMRSFTRRDDESGEEVEIVFSDLGLLVKALDVPVPENPTDTELANALIAAAGKEFTAEHTLSCSCNKTRDIFKDGKSQQGIKGCGLQYSSDPYTKKDGTEVLMVPKVSGEFAIRFACSCGAELRAWSNLRGFRSA